MNRAYSLLTTKAFDEDDDYFRIEGIASTPSPDRTNDVVKPMGAKFQTPMPLLWQHNHQMPVGHVTFAKPTAQGIPFKAEIPKVKEEGTLKNRIDEAIQSLKYKLVAAVSIGFKSDDFEYKNDGGIIFNSWDWLELSLVTIPANPEAQIRMMKNLDQDALAATGNPAPSPDNQEKAGATVRKPIQLIPRTRS